MKYSQIYIIKKERKIPSFKKEIIMAKNKRKRASAPYYTISLTLVNNTSAPICEYGTGPCQTSVNINLWTTNNPLPAGASVTFDLSGYAGDIFTFNNNQGSDCTGCTGCQYGFDQNGNFGYQSPCAHVGNGNCKASDGAGNNYCASGSSCTIIIG